MGAEETGEPVAGGGVSERHCRVLLVEDDADFRDYVRAILSEDHGVRYQIDAKGRLDAAEVVASRFDYDAALVDLNLPDSRGLHTIERVREATRSRGRPAAVIAMTALDDPALSLQAVERGIQDYVFKSEIDRGRLGRVVQHAIARERILGRIERDRERLEQAHFHDRLTGLKSRAFLDLRAREELERAREFGHPLSLAVFDLDRFKAINDRFGHPAGDQALQAFAAALNAATRPTDLASRYGGDEFVVLLPYTTALEAAMVVERVREAAAASELVLDGVEVEVQASAGVAELGARHGGCLALFAEADEALYRAKGASDSRRVRRTSARRRATTQEILLAGGRD